MTAPTQDSTDVAIDYAPKADLARYICWFFYCATLACFGYWRLEVAPVPDANNLLLWAAQSSLLLIFLPVIIRGKPKSYAWFCFALIPYFMITVEAAMSPNTQLIGILSSACVAILFSAAMMYTRWQARRLKANQ